jgi:hypothetical protein
MKLFNGWDLAKITVSLEEGIAGGRYSMQACHPLHFLRQELYSLLFTCYICQNFIFFQIEKNCFLEIFSHQK